MKQIKTIVCRLNNAGDFDHEVNEAIEEGWTLIERKVLQPPAQPNDCNTYLNNMLYAELEKFTEPDETEDSPLTNLIENLAALAGALTAKAKPKKMAPPREGVDDDDPCINCKHVDVPFYEEPCQSCNDYDKWEEAEAREDCSNCKHRKTPCTAEPCIHCDDGNGTKWEPAEGKT